MFSGAKYQKEANFFHVRCKMMYFCRMILQNVRKRIFSVAKWPRYKMSALQIGRFFFRTLQNVRKGQIYPLQNVPQNGCMPSFGAVG